MSAEYLRARGEVVYLMAQASVWINALEPDEAALLLARAHEDLDGEVAAGAANLMGSARLVEAFRDAMGYSVRVPDAPGAFRVVEGGDA